jgi:hypothetical protein
MSNLETSGLSTEVAIDPFADPVGFLAAHGIEAELVEHISCLPEAA